jgi:hypothetical protein
MAVESGISNVLRKSVDGYQWSFLQKCPFVIPSEDGIQVFQGFLDPGFRRGDGLAEFCKMLNEYTVCITPVKAHQPGCGCLLD